MLIFLAPFFVVAFALVVAMWSVDDLPTILVLAAGVFAFVHLGLVSIGAADPLPL